MARTERLSILVDPEMAAELRGMAKQLHMPLSTFLWTLLTIAMNASGGVFQTFGNTIEGLMGADAEHDKKS